MRFFLRTCFLILTICLAINLSAQEDIHPFLIPENETNKLPQIIIERDYFHFWMGITWYQYQYLDGTLLKYNNVRSIISIVPENRSILNQERGWLIANITSASLFFGSLITWSIYSNDNLPNANIVRKIAGYSGFCTFFTAMISRDVSMHKMRKALTNYNFYVQGIPIP